MVSSTKRILILSANPKDTSRLHLDEEVREIEEGLTRSKHRDQFKIYSAWAIRLRDLRRAMLDYQPHIVHFCGHGEEIGLMLEDEHGNAIPIDSDALTGLFELFKNQVECVLLNACYSQAQTEAINKHINYVIGMSQGITDEAAIEFAIGFYDALGAGKSVEEAFKFGRNAIQLYNIPEHLTPVLKKKHFRDKEEWERVSQADNFYRSGFDHFRHGELDKAKIFLTKSILLNPDHWEATLFLGRTYLEQRQFEKAIEILERTYQYDPLTSQPFLLQALKAEVDRSHDPFRKIKLYERIQEIQSEDQTAAKLKQQVELLRGRLKNVQGYAVLEVELLNRQEDLIWQNEIVLKVQIRNKGNIPANNVNVRTDENKAYKLLSDSIFSVNFITPGDMTEVDFQIQPFQEQFTLNLIISYTDAIDEIVKEQIYEHNIQLSRQQGRTFERIDNPYRSGNLTQYLQQGDTSMFYGRRDTIQELKQILIENNEGVVILYGQRRTGKSCLLKYIEKAKCFEPDVLIIFTNIQGLASEQDLYGDILNQAAHLTNTTPNIKTKVHSFDEFMTSLCAFQEAVKTPFLIMLDEFEYVTDERFKYTSLQDATDFIRRFRSLMQYSSRIKFALAGADGLRTMIKDYHNPLFKAGRTFQIAFLSPQDARALMIEPLQDKLIYTEQAITSIHQATADHPYYIQLLCQTIVMLLNQKKNNTVTITEVNQAIEYIEKTGDSDFDYVWDITSKEAHLLLAIIAQEMQIKQWVALERIEEMIAEHKLCLPEESVDTALKELLEKNLIIESHAKLEYTIPMGLLRTWVTRYKPLKKVRREVKL